LSSVVANQRQRIKIVETGETIQMTAPDQVLISGVLQSGAVASVHLKGGTTNGTGFLFEIHGTEGDLAIVPADPRQATYIQVFRVRCARCAGGQTAGGSLDTGELSMGSTRGPAGASFQRCAAVRADG
jgi:hypothetical protein